MKKTVFLFGAIFFLNMFSTPSHAFDFYGCWKAEKERKANNVICFYKNSVRSDKKKYPDPIYKEENGKIFVHIPSTFGAVAYKINDDNSISMISPSPTVKYIRISEEEAKNILK